MVDNKTSKYSNSKFIVIKESAGFVFTHTVSNRATLSENGTRVVGTGVHGGSSVNSVCSSTGWNSGKHSWKIKCNSRSNKYHYDGVGVTTDYSNKGWLYSGGKTLYYNVYTGPNILKNSSSIKSVEKWKPNDVIT
eukprot:71582_1